MPDVAAPRSSSTIVAAICLTTGSAERTSAYRPDVGLPRVTGETPGNSYPHAAGCSANRLYRTRRPPYCRSHLTLDVSHGQARLRELPCVPHVLDKTNPDSDTCRGTHARILHAAYTMAFTVASLLGRRYARPSLLALKSVDLAAAARNPADQKNFPGPPPGPPRGRVAPNFPARQIFHFIPARTGCGQQPSNLTARAIAGTGLAN